MRSGLRPSLQRLSQSICKNTTFNLFLSFRVYFFGSNTYNIKEQPTLTFIARQYGEAWKHPFVAVFEPSTQTEPGTIARVSYPKVEGNESAVAIQITHKDGTEDRILSSDDAGIPCRMNGMSITATYALQSTVNGETKRLFMGNGTLLRTSDITIESHEPADVLLEWKNGTWYYTASKACKIRLEGKEYQLQPAENAINVIKL